MRKFSPANLSPFMIYCNVITVAGLKITLPLYLLFSFLHNRISCKHNACTVDNLTPLDMLFLSISYSFIYKPNKSKNHTSTFVYYLLFVKMEVHFYLRNWFGQNQSSQTVSAGPVSLHYK